VKPSIRKYRKTTKGRAARKAQKKRASQRRIARYRFLRQSLFAYSENWGRSQRIRSLFAGWRNAFGWINTSSIREYKSRYYNLARAWKRCFGWTSLIGTTTTYTEDPEISGNWLIYGLVDPRTLMIRYIGQSVKGLARPRQHRNRSGGYSSYKTNWIKELRSLGLDFNIVILEFVEDGNKDAICKAEQWWISYGKLSSWPLTNLTDGGDTCIGRVLSEETKNKIRNSRKIFLKTGTYKNTAGW
jgi:hypothetical protein